MKSFNEHIIFKGAYLTLLFKLQVLISCLGRLLCARSELQLSKEETSDDVTPIIYDNEALRHNGVSRHGKASKAEMHTAKEIQAEWKTLATVVDRVFFIFYLVGMALSIVYVFPR